MPDIALNIIKAKTQLEKGLLPNTAIIQALRKFSNDIYEHFESEPHISQELKSYLAFISKELSRDGGVNLSAEQLVKASHLYSKKISYITFTLSSVNSYFSWAKDYFKNTMSYRILEIEKFPTGVSNKDLKEFYILNEEKKNYTKNKQVLSNLKFTINLCENLVSICSDEIKRNDRHQTVLNRLLEARNIQLKDMLVKNRRHS